MAVYFLVGFLGAGKSLSAVARIYQYLFAGRPVATNLDLKLPKLVGKKKQGLCGHSIAGQTYYF